MRIPKSFKINGKRWRVRWHKSPELYGEAAEGTCEPDKRLITLKRGVDKPVQVFWHEWIHAVLFEYCFHVTSIHEDVEEILAECLSQQLEEFLRLRRK